MKKLPLSIIIIVTLTQSAMAWQVPQRIPPPSGVYAMEKIEQSVLLGGIGECFLAVFTLALPAIVGGVGGAAAGIYYGRDLLLNLQIDWFPIYSGNQLSKSHAYKQSKASAKVKKMKLTTIQKAVFNKLSDKDLRQMYGVSRIGKLEKMAYAKGVSIAKITGKIAVPTKTFKFRMPKIGGYSR